MVLERVHRKADLLSSAERKEAVTGTLRTVTNVWTPPLVRKTFISLNEKLYRTYVTDALGSAKNCFVESILDDVNNGLQGVPTERHENCKEVEYDRVALIYNDLQNACKIIVMFAMFKHNFRRKRSRVLLL